MLVWQVILVTAFQNALSGDKDIYVLEISSFQLDDIKKFRPNISVITNIIEDHMDRYENDLVSMLMQK